MVKVFSGGTESIVIADGLTRGQAERIAGIIMDALEEERQESQASTSGIGTKNLIPCGRFQGLTVNDVYQQFAFEGLSELLHCNPELLDESRDLINPAFYSVPYPFIVSLNSEMVVYTCMTLLTNMNGCNPITLDRFLSCFGDFLPKDLSGFGYRSAADIQPDAVPEEKRTDLLMDLNQALQEKWLAILQNTTFQEEKALDCDLKITGGIFSGLRICDVFLSDRYRGIVKLLCTVRQMENGSQLYRSVLLYTLTFLRHREYMPFADFLDAFGAFFPAEDTASLLALPQEKQDGEYQRLSFSLGRRMLKSLEETMAGQAA